MYGFDGMRLRVSTQKHPSGSVVPRFHGKTDSCILGSVWFLTMTQPLTTVDERALFHLLNLAREADAYVLLTGRVPPSAFDTELRDLRSRLRAVPVVPLSPPDDPLFRALIVKFCADRQMVVDESLVGYLTTRIERSPAAARRAVEMLDAEALRRGRPVTRALAAEVLRDDAA